MYVPTSYVTVLKNVTTTDAYGDEADSHTAVQTRVGVHISEQSKVSFDPQSGKSVTVRYLQALLPAELTIEKGYRLYDEAAEQFFFIEHVEKTNSFVGAGHQIAELKRVS